ncbi:expressed unknown protein [Seminavis robusta]|uniref:Transmembrane protein n=1 Tax=Seminavis robusta TaxID=568900 RepID=A0A9N8DUT7_9STRA|nr:expressed unknown protein [Seminavis robusta]|eukprot:Sro298_g111030.1 n/a (102) ;mRNA; f:15962-16349
MTSKQKTSITMTSKPFKDDMDSSNNSHTECLDDDPSFRPSMLQVHRLQSVDEEAVLKEEEAEVEHPCKSKVKYVVGAAFFVVVIIFAVFMISRVKNSTLAS